MGFTVAEASVDQLRITIESKADSARSSINSLADDVSKLKRTLSGFGSGASALVSSISKINSAASSANGIRKLADEVSRFSGLTVSKTIGTNLGLIAQNASGFTGGSELAETASAIREFSGFKISASIGNQLANIKSGVEGLNSVPVDTTKFEQLKSALTGLSEIPKSSLSSTITALNKLPALAAKLQGMDMSGFKTQCEQLSSALGKLPDKMGKVASGIFAVQKASGSDSVSKFSKGIASSSEETAKFIKRLSNLASAIRTISTLVGVFTSVSGAIGYCVDQSNKYIENMNLAETSLGAYSEQAERYANAIQSTLGINAGQFLSNQGTFMTMASGMGVATDNAYKMSKGLTQLSYDIASFFNISDDEAFQKVKSGLAGEIEPLRALGYDLTNARLQQEAYSIGITESVSNMTQAEKAMLRYKAIMSQVSWSQGDLAKTASSPANQIRILKSQLLTAAQSIGNVFLPMLQSIIPVAVAVVKAVATLANMLAEITGGTKIATAGFGDGGDVTSALQGTSDAADDASDSLSDAGDAAGSAGDSADDAAKKVKELNRQLMGFDEINKFSKQSDSSSGSGSGSGGTGSGGSGSGSGSPTSISDIVLDDYDWSLGDGFGDELYNEIMSFLKRLSKAFAPLVNDFKVLAQAIQHQFDGLDISGAVKNAVAGAANLVSNAVRDIIEIVGPLAVAFNFPQTAAYAFNLAAQMCLTLSAAVNGVSSMVKGFTDRALVPLASWIGGKLRGAIKVCIEILQTWQGWFVDNLSGLNDLGKAAGTSAGLVLRLAAAVADGAFTVFAGAIKAVNTVLQTLLSMLVGSAAARAAATLLGGALASWAVGGAIKTGIGAITTAVGFLTEKVKGHASETSAASTAIGAAVDGMNAKFGELKDAISDQIKKTTENHTFLAKLAGRYKIATARVEAYAAKKLELKSADELERNAAKLTSERTEKLRQEVEKTSKAYETAKKKSDAETVSLDELRSSLGDSASFSDKLAMKQLALSTKVSTANTKIAAGKKAMAEAKLQASTYSSETGSLASNLAIAAVNEGKAASQIAIGTAQKALATAGTTALTVAQGLLNVAAAAFPGAILAIALQGIYTVLQPLIDTVGSFVLGLLGLNDSTGDVTDSTEEANEALEEERDQINENVQSLQEYEQTHDNLADALAMAGFSEETFASYLQQTGETVDDVKNKVSDYESETINSFSKIATDTSASLGDFRSALENNIQVTKQFHDNMQTIMKKTGLDSSSALIQQMLQSGPEGCANAAAEMASKSKEELQWMVEDNKAIADNATNAVISEYKASAAEAQQAGSDLGAAVESGLENSSASVQQTAKAEGAATVSNYAQGVSSTSFMASNATKSMGEMATAQLNASSSASAKKAGSDTTSSYASGVSSTSASASTAASQTASTAASSLNDGGSGAKSAGRNLVGGYSDGISEAGTAASSAAGEVMTAAVQALNGGTGYNKAKSAGRNLLGGYKDGISDASAAAKTAAQGTCSGVVSALGSGASRAKSAASSIMSSFRSGISTGSSSASTAARSVSNAAAKALGGGTSSASSAGKALGNAFKTGLSGVSASSAGGSVAKSASSGMNDERWRFSNCGYNAGIGFASGIADSADSVYRVARSVASNAAKIMRSALSIHSPSRVTAEIGMYFDLGFAGGIERYSSDVSDSVEDMAVGALDITRSAAEIGSKVGSAYGSAIESGLDVNGVKTALGTVESMARNYSAPSAGFSSAKYPSHEQAVTKLDSDGVAEVVSRAVVRSMLTMQPSSQASGGNTTIVLRVGDEDIAKATMRGQESLARRGVIDLG